VATQAISLYSGENKTLRITVTDSTLAAVDLTGAVLTFTVRKTAASNERLIHKTTAAPTEGAVLTPPTDGVAEIYLVPADTAGLISGDYQYDLWVDNLAPGATTHILVEPSAFEIEDPVREWVT